MDRNSCRCPPPPSPPVPFRAPPSALSCTCTVTTPRRSPPRGFAFISRPPGHYYRRRTQKIKEGRSHKLFHYPRGVLCGIPNRAPAGGRRRGEAPPDSNDRLGVRVARICFHTKCFTSQPQHTSVESALPFSILDCSPIGLLGNFFLPRRPSTLTLRSTLAA